MNIETRRIDTAIYPEVAYFARRTKPAGPETIYKVMIPDGHPEEFKGKYAWGLDETLTATLAFTLLLDATSNMGTTLKYYQEFNLKFVSSWGNNWAITRSAILQWIRNMEAQTLQDRSNQNKN